MSEAHDVTYDLLKIILRKALNRFRPYGISSYFFNNSNNNNFQRVVNHMISYFFPFCLGVLKIWPSSHECNNLGGVCLSGIYM